MHYPFLTFVSDCHNVLLLGMKKKVRAQVFVRNHVGSVDHIVNVGRYVQGGR